MLFALISGLSVASNYYAQPLLGLFASEFRVGAVQAALVVTLAQLGYIAGLVFVVPLGDRMERRVLLTTMIGLTTLALLGMSVSPHYAMLLACALLLGLSSVGAQIVVPQTAQLSPAATRGRTVSVVMAALLTGILLARTGAGLIAELGGWRAVYLLASVLMLACAIACWRVMPRVPASSHVPYRALLLSILGLFRTVPVLRRRALVGGLGFGALACFWTAMAFMLRDAHGLTEGTIGLFALSGLAGALCARFAGRLADAGWARPATGGFVLATGASWLPLAFGETSLLAFALGIVLLDLGVQGMHISNQSEIYRLDPAARSRLTTGYMACYFLGGAFGSVLAGLAYSAGGWRAVCALGLAFSVGALAVWGRGEFRWPMGAMKRDPAG